LCFIACTETVRTQFAMLLRRSNYSKHLNPKGRDASNEGNYMKVILAALILALVSGCRTNPSRTWTDIDFTNAPDKFERKDYFEICIGQSVHSSNHVDPELRVACVNAVLNKS
jgi:hypothetical protein